MYVFKVWGWGYVCVLCKHRMGPYLLSHLFSLRLVLKRGVSGRRTVGD